MSFINSYNQATASAGNSEIKEPPPGHYIAQISDARFGQTKPESKRPGETYAVVEYSFGEYRWIDYRQLTVDKQIQPKRVDAFKSLLASLGLADQYGTDEQLEAALKGLVGRYYALDVKNSSSINANTGAFYISTYISGPATAPSLAASDVTPAAATLDQAMTQPGAQYGDDIPWDQPQGVQPSPVQQGVAPAQNVGVAPMQNTNVVPQQS